MKIRSELPKISARLVESFIEATSQEVGPEKLPAILTGDHLLRAAIEKGFFSRVGGLEAAEIYASYQEALRRFYGRGARGILLRIGQGLWDRSVTQANFREKTELEIARRFPVPARRRRILELVAGILRDGGGATSVHTLDMDLLLVDNSAAATAGQTSTEPICFVTLGLIRQAFFWGTAKEVDVEETACKAMGAAACEFKIKPGGK